MAERTDIPTERHTERRTYRHAETDRLTHSAQTDTPDCTYKHTGRQTDIQTDICTDIQTDRQTNRHTDIQTYRRTDRHADRQNDNHAGHFCVSLFANCMTQFLLDRLGIYITLFVSTVIPSSHTFASQFGLAICFWRKTPNNYRENRVVARVFS